MKLIGPLINLLYFSLKICSCHVPRSSIIHGNKFGLDNMRDYACDSVVVCSIN